MSHFRSQFSNCFAAPWSRYFSVPACVWPPQFWILVRDIQPFCSESDPLWAWVTPKELRWWIRLSLQRNIKSSCKVRQSLGNVLKDNESDSKGHRISLNRTRRWWSPVFLHWSQSTSSVRINKLKSSVLFVHLKCVPLKSIEEAQGRID